VPERLHEDFPKLFEVRSDVVSLTDDADTQVRCKGKCESDAIDPVQESRYEVLEKAMRSIRILFVEHLGGELDRLAEHDRSCRWQWRATIVETRLGATEQRQQVTRLYVVLDESQR